MPKNSLSDTSAATYINDFHAKEGRMPSYAEAAELLGYKSKDTAYKLIQKLVARGLVRKDSKGKLIPAVIKPRSSATAQSTKKSSVLDIKSGVRLLGLVEAGFPTPSEETDLDTVTLDEWMIRDTDRTFMLRVKGDSMIEAGIHHGDYVIVERTSSAPVGSIVISDIDGSWTMKYLRKDAQGYYLEAANAEYDIMRPESGLQISAMVIGLVRKYI
ncbi:MAG TPA: S24 family peptidase [Candidatus Paceibacterota bacterium]